MYFFFNDTATTEIYTLSLHDALPISGDATEIRLDPLPAPSAEALADSILGTEPDLAPLKRRLITDRKSTRLNSSHGYISYAVFCLKKKSSTTLSSRNTASRSRRSIGD